MCNMNWHERDCSCMIWCASHPAGVTFSHFSSELQAILEVQGVRIHKQAPWSGQKTKHDQSPRIVTFLVGDPSKNVICHWNPGRGAPQRMNRGGHFVETKLQGAWSAVASCHLTLATLKLPTDEDVEAEHLGAVWLRLGAHELALPTVPTQCQAAREQLNQMSDVAAGWFQ